jgi:methylmalonyl-CoA mutase, N-terminal domain
MSETLQAATNQADYQADYQALVARTTARSPERRADFVTASGIPVGRVYVQGADGSAVEVSSAAAINPSQGLPGLFPFTRGVQPTMYRGRFWTMRQYAGFGSAAQTNERFRYLLANGQTGLSLAFDLPTQLGYDSDHERAEGEVGRVGVAIDSVEDMQAVFEGIPLGEVSTSMTINAPAAILLAMYVVAAERSGVSRAQLAGTVQNDVLKEYIARGTYIFPPQQSLRLCTDIIEFCAREMPRFNPISISGYHMREAGCTAVQEIAFALSNGVTYAREALARGLSFDEFAPRLSFFFASWNHLLEEVAKFRAARRIWARLARDEFSSVKPAAQMLRFHTQTAGSSLTAQQPVNNVVRVALQALAAVLGGTQSLHTNSYDEALALPTEESSLLALRTQQIIAHEIGVTDTVDPLGGSYYVEHLTDELERRVDSYFAEIARRGGMLASIESGYVMREIQNAAYSWQQDVESGKEVVVGVNRYTSTEKPHVNLLKLSPALESERQAAVAALRAQRNVQAWEQSLVELEAAARTKVNLMPLIIEAVRAQATVGEITDVLRKVWGTHRPPRDF